MKRIALLVCGLLLLVANSAEARRGRYYSNYVQPTYAAPVVYNVPAAQPARVVTPVSHTTTASTAASNTASPAPAKVTPAPKSAFDTSTAQGVANIMASRGVVGHFGGNPGYEGCGMAATREGAYNICCYANSGMATVDVGYAQGANGMWYCCRRYR